MANTNVNEKTKVVTGKVRFSYAHVFEPASINGEEAKYSVSILIDKKDTKTISKIEKAVEAAKHTGVSKFGGKIPANLKLPLRDGDTDREGDSVYAGKYFINANCKQKPGIVDKSGNAIIDPTEFYSGCYGYASVTEDGEPLGGRSSAEDDFAGLFSDDEDFLD